MSERPVPTQTKIELVIPDGDIASPALTRLTAEEIALYAQEFGYEIEPNFHDLSTLQYKIARVKYALTDEPTDNHLSRGELIRQIFADELATGDFTVEQIKIQVTGHSWHSVKEKMHVAFEISTDGDLSQQFPLTPEQLECLVDFPRTLDLMARLSEDERYQGKTYEDLIQCINTRKPRFYKIPIVMAPGEERSK